MLMAFVLLVGMVSPLLIAVRLARALAARVALPRNATRPALLPAVRRARGTAAVHPLVHPDRKDHHQRKHPIADLFSTVGMAMMLVVSYIFGIAHLVYGVFMLPLFQMFFAILYQPVMSLTLRVPKASAI
jgi:hypothetical protein